MSAAKRATNGTSRRGEQCRNSHIVRRQRVRDALEHPGAAQIQAVDVRELGVGAVGHDPRHEPRRARLLRAARAGTAVRDLRQEMREPESCARECGDSSRFPTGFESDRRFDSDSQVKDNRGPAN